MLIITQTFFRLQIDNTIENRILQIQQRKTAIVKAAFRGSGTQGEPESIQNLKLMFGD
jgi:DNA repair protein RAD5